MSSQSATIGIIKDIFAQPLVYALEKNFVPHPFVLQYNSLAENAQKLAEGEIQAALISPIDYGRHAMDWEIIPGLAISSYGITGAAKILFKKGLNVISAIATDIRFPTEMVIAQIVFLEKSGIKPRFITREVQPGIVPESTDAVLLVGNDALPVKTSQESVFDLSEEWNDMVELPLVHAVFAAQRGKLSQTSAALLLQSHSYFAEHKQVILSDLSRQTGIDTDRLNIHLNEELRYTLDDTDIDGMKEIFRHSFYHGILGEIPDIAFLRSATDDQTRLN